MTLATGERDWSGWHFAALLGGNAALALGPLWVRLADTGPVSAGFWRLLLAVPVFILLARTNGQRLLGHGKLTIAAILGAGLFFSLDLASWHLGIERTRLGNATLFGNTGSILLVAVGLIALRRAPRAMEWAAFVAAIAGSVTKVLPPITPAKPARPVPAPNTSMNTRGTLWPSASAMSGWVSAA